VTAKTAKHITRRTNLARFPSSKDWSRSIGYQPSVDRKQIQTLSTCRYLEHGENLVLSGPPGVGKRTVRIAVVAGWLRWMGCDSKTHWRLSSCTCPCRGYVRLATGAAWPPSLGPDQKLVRRVRSDPSQSRQAMFPKAAPFHSHSLGGGMARLSEQVDFVIGVDTHKASHTGRPRYHRGRPCQADVTGGRLRILTTPTICSRTCAGAAGVGDRRHR
jgi:IstB-like ATP binding protein